MDKQTKTPLSLQRLAANELHDTLFVPAHVAKGRVCAHQHCHTKDTWRLWIVRNGYFKCASSTRTNFDGTTYVEWSLPIIQSSCAHCHFAYERFVRYMENVMEQTCCQAWVAQWRWLREWAEIESTTRPGVCRLTVTEQGSRTFYQKLRRQGANFECHHGAPSVQAFKEGREFWIGPGDTHWNVGAPVGSVAHMDWLYGEYDRLDQVRDSMYQMREEHPVSSAWQMEQTQSIESGNESGFAEVTSHVVDQKTVNSKTEKNIGVVANVKTADSVTVISRDYLVRSNVAWNNLGSTGTVLAWMPFPQTFFQDTLAVRGMIDWHTFYRSDFKIKIKIPVTPMHCGMLVLFWWPGMAPALPVAEGSVWPLGFSSITQLIHKFVFAGAAENTAEIIVPFSRFRRAMRTNDTNPMGRVCIAVWNQLKVPTSGSNTLNVSVYAEAIDSVTNVKIPKTSNPIPSVVSYQMDSGHADLIQEVVGGVAGLGGLALQGISDMVKSAFEVGPYDSPSVITAGYKTLTAVDVARDVASVAPSLKDKFTVSAEMFSGVPQEYDLLTRMKKRARVAQVPWANSQTSGGNLGLFPVTPMVDKVVNGTGVFVHDPTPLSFFGNFYTYWRGGIDITFEVVGTNFHKGQLMAAFVPATFIPITMAQARTCTYLVMDVGAENNVFTFRVPYVADADWKGVSLEVTEQQDNNFATGTVQLFVLNPLTTNGTVAPTIDVNVYYNAADDFEYAVIRGPAYGVNGSTGVQILVDSTFQMDTKGAKSGGRVGKSSASGLDKTATHSAFQPIVTGAVPSMQLDNHMDVRNLMRRMWYDRSVAPTGEFGLRDYGSLQGLNTVPLQALAQCWAFWAGSMRYHLLTTATPIGATYRFYFLSFYDGANVGTRFTAAVPVQAGMMHANSATSDMGINFADRQVVVHVPFYKHTPVASTFRETTDPDVVPLFGPTACPGVRVVMNTPTGGTSQAYFDVFQSVGDDFQLFLPLVMPLVQSPRTRVIAGRYKFVQPWLPEHFNVGVDGVDGEDDEVCLSSDEQMECASEEQGFKDIWKGVRDFVKAIRSVGTTADTINSLGSAVAMKDSLDWIVIFAKQLIPFINAVHSILVGNSTMQIVGVAGVVQCVSSFVNDVASRRHVATSRCDGPAKNAKDSMGCVNSAEQGKTSLVEVILTTVASASGVVRSLHEESVGFVKKHFGRLGDKCAGVLTLLVFFINTNLYNIGKVLSPDCAAYILRVCGKPDDSLAYLAKIIGAGIEWLVYGKSANVEYERELISRAQNLTIDFRTCQSDGEFLPINMYREYRGKTSLVRIKEMRDEANDITKNLNGTVVSPSFTAVVADIHATYLRLMRQIDSAGSQPEPLGVLLYGTPGCGKSAITTQILAPIVLRTLGYKGNMDNHLYRVPLGEGFDFWDLYAQQPACFVDELLQDANGKEVLRILTLISSARNAVNMADLKEKLTTFNSKVFFACTNVSNADVVNTVIRDKQAFIRRFPHAYKMSVRSGSPCAKVNGGKNSELNYAKLAEELTKLKGDEKKIFELLDATFRFDAWDFEKGDFNTTTDSEGKRKRICIPFSSVVASIVSDIRGRESAYGDLKKAVDGVLFSSMQMMKTGAVDRGISEVRAEVHRADSISSCDDDSAYLDACNAMHVTRDEGTYVCELPPGRMRDLIVVPHPALAPYVMPPCGDTPDFCYRVEDAATNISDQFGVERGREFAGKELFEKWPEVDELSYRQLRSCKTYMDDWELAERFPARYNEVVQAIGVYTNRTPGYNGMLGVLAGFVVLGVFSTAVYLVIKAATRALVSTFQAYTHSFVKKVVEPKSTVKAMSSHQDLSCEFQSKNCADVAARVAQNVRWVVLKDGDMNTVASMHCLFVDDRHMLMPAHFFKKYQTTVIHIGTSDPEARQLAPYAIQSHVRLRYRGTATDAVLVRLVCAVQSIRNIRDHFMTLSEVERFASGAFRVVMLNGHKDPEVSIDGKYKRVYVHPDDLDGKDCVMIECNLARITRNGECGKPYLFDTNLASRPLFGIHARYNTYMTTGYPACAPVSAEGLETAFAELPHTAVKPQLQDEVVHMSEEQADCKFWTCDIPLTRAACNGVPLVHHGPTDTALRPLTYGGELLKHPDWECEWLPAAFRGRDGKHPLYTNAQKYHCMSITAPCFGKTQVVTSEYLTHIRVEESPRPLTFFEAYNGYGTLQPLNWKTGCGFWTMFGFKDGKSEFFDPLPQEPEQPVKYVLSEKACHKHISMFGCTFQERLVRMDQMIQHGTVPVTFWVSTLKDELRSLEKVRAVKTRVFEQPGLDFTILFRRYFGQFLDWYRSHGGFTLAHGIGHDKEVVWKEYAETLLHHSPVGLAFDYTNYDGTVSRSAHQFWLDVTDHFYMRSTPAEQAARHALSAVIRDARHIVGEYVFRSSQGNKSGNAATDVYNSVTNAFVLRLTYLTTASAAGVVPPPFDDSVKMLTYGDDAVLSVAAPCLEYYNGGAIQEHMAAIGMTITSAVKASVIEHHIPFDQMTFLKSSFREEGGVWFAPLPKKEIYKELCWRPKNTIGDELDLKQRVANTQRFMAHHGRDDLLQFQKQLLERGIPRAWVSLDYDYFVWDVAQKQLTADLF